MITGNYIKMFHDTSKRFKFNLTLYSKLFPHILFFQKNIKSLTQGTTKGGLCLASRQQWMTEGEHWGAAGKTEETETEWEKSSVTTLVATYKKTNAIVQWCLQLRASGPPDRCSYFLSAHREWWWKGDRCLCQSKAFLGRVWEWEWVTQGKMYTILSMTLHTHYDLLIQCRSL